MSKEKPIDEGYLPVKKGYQPNQSADATSKPPQGGSGVPQNPSNDNKRTDKKE